MTQTPKKAKPAPEPLPPRIPNAWIVRLGDLAEIQKQFMVLARGLHTDFESLEDGDALMLVHEPSNQVVGFAGVYRVRSNVDDSTIYFDRLEMLAKEVSASSLGVTWPSMRAAISRLDLPTFQAALKSCTGLEFTDVAFIQNETYMRELLQLATIDDLLGPANGPFEEIPQPSSRSYMSVRDRYLVGKISPRERDPLAAAFQDGVLGSILSEEEEPDTEPDDLRVKTAERLQNSAGQRMGLPDTDPDEEPAELDASTNQSLVPNSLGLTFCVDADVTELEIEARWGRYERGVSEKYVDERTQKPLRAWKRIPSGGKIIVPLREGKLEGRWVDIDCPSVMVQGQIRPVSQQGNRLVTVFLTNGQIKPETSEDAAWLFQPELTVRSTNGQAIFRRRLPSHLYGHDHELAALEMIYRRRVEFASGHGVAIHATVSADDPEQAVEVRTAVLPEYEVAVTETPGLVPEDRDAMKRMVNEGLLDMQRLGTLERSDLVRGLRILTDDYGAWIKEQRARIGRDVIGFDTHANDAMGRAERVLERLREGIDVLEQNDNALEAFRFANMAMASQRIRSQYALERRRAGEQIDTVQLEKFDVPKNRSWRQFQLAFVLLSIPALADPRHPDRTGEIEAFADLLWFPTGGGKTEAYLGVAAFTMAVRRLQGDLGGLDASRGLAVIMRYTLRLLTLQQFQRASTLLCAMEVQRQANPAKWGEEIFSIGLWVGQKVTPNSNAESHEAILKERGDGRPTGSTPAQLTTCPWCGAEIKPGRDVDVDKERRQTLMYCGDAHGTCEFSKARAKGRGLPVVVVDEEIYQRPPSMLIATVDKFALMAWRGEIRTLFGKASQECARHGLLWPNSECKGIHNKHPKRPDLPATKLKMIKAMRPPDLISQDEFHLISGPLGTMVGLFETTVDKLSSWTLEGHTVRPKVIASTATVRKANEQVRNVFLRRVSIFPPSGLDVEDNFFSVQRPIAQNSGRRYVGVCAPGSSKPAMLIRVYVALLTAGQALFNRFGDIADPYMTVVGYFNALRELGGMKRLAEDDVQTRAYRVRMSNIERPGLAQRSLRIVDELTSRVSSREIPKKLDALETKHRRDRKDGEERAMDVVLATNMLSVGVDVNRLGVMAVNGQPKTTAEYIQATSRVGRSHPGIVWSVLAWSRPRDLSHFETFEHYHATFYKHVEAQSVTPFAPRALDRGLTGAMVSLLRLENEGLNPNIGAGTLINAASTEARHAEATLSDRAHLVKNKTAQKETSTMSNDRLDRWAKEASRPGRHLGYEAKRGQGTMVGLLQRPGLKPWDELTAPMSMREVEAGVNLVMDGRKIDDGPEWQPMIKRATDEHEDGETE